MPNGRFAHVVRALKHRNFRLFFTGQLISLVGTWMQTVAQSWLVYRKTGSALLLGTVGFASQFPVFLISPVGGIVSSIELKKGEQHSFLANVLKNESRYQHGWPA